MEPPKELIINAILKAIYLENTTDSIDQRIMNYYELPDNLKRFFDSLEKSRIDRFPRKTCSTIKMVSYMFFCQKTH